MRRSQRPLLTTALKRVCSPLLPPLQAIVVDYVFGMQPNCEIGDECIVRDHAGNWYVSTIVGKKQEQKLGMGSTLLCVHYNGWSTWDEWIPLGSHRLTDAGWIGHIQRVDGVDPMRPLSRGCGTPAPLREWCVPHAEFKDWDDGEEWPGVDEMQLYKHESDKAIESRLHTIAD